MNIVELNKKLTRFKKGDIVQIKGDINNFYTIESVIYDSDIDIVKYELKNYREHVRQDSLRLIREGQDIKSNNKNQNIDAYFVNKNKETINKEILDTKEGLQYFCDYKIDYIHNRLTKAYCISMESVAYLLDLYNFFTELACQLHFMKIEQFKKFTIEKFKNIMDKDFNNMEEVTQTLAEYIPKK